MNKPKSKTKGVEFRPGELNVVCSDLERSTKFYRDVLGFSELAIGDCPSSDRT